MTEQDRTDFALRESEERFRSAVEASPSGMVMMSDGRIVMVNVQAEKLFGYGRDELIGQPTDLLVPPRFRKSRPPDVSCSAAKAAPS